MATKRRLIKHLPLMLAGLALGLGVFVSVDGFRSNKPVEPTFATYTNGDGATYYNSLDTTLFGNSFLTKLRELNLSKRKTTVGYSSMGTDPSGQFKYTDYDTNYVQYDSNGQPYGTRISSFYTFTSATSWNREHVWPNSHGGGSKGDAGTPYPDADIHMPRPTISEENSDRGNSFYVEGMNSTSAGWDPSTAGYNANSRGEAARITFYCTLVNSKLVLAPNNTTPSGNDPVTGQSYGSGHTMGNLETLIKWNINYPVSQREQNRNEGAEYLQGNRNAFIDHPEYACKIWGNVNSTIRNMCTNAGHEVPVGVDISKSTQSLTVGDTTTISATSTNSSTITWTTSNASVVGISNGTANSGSSITLTAVAAGSATITAKATISGIDYTATCAVAVKASSSTSGDNYEVYSGSLTEGDYLITYDGKAMKNEISSNRLSYASVSPSNDVISNVDSSLVWHIAPTSSYWSIYSASVSKYAAGNGTKNQATLIDSVTDFGMWTVSGSSTTYEFVNKGNSGTSINANLRGNGTYGFACYGTSTGGALTLYKKVSSSLPEKTLSSISVVGQTVSFTRGDSFSFGGTVTATFSDGTTSDVTTSSTFSGYNMETLGSQTVTVTYTYNETTKTTTFEIFIGTGRTVIETTTISGYVLIGTITYPSNTQTISSNSISVSTSGYTAIESNSIRLGSGSNTGSVTVTSTTTNITKVVVSAKSYGSDSSVHLLIDSNDNTITSSYSNYEKEYNSAVKTLSVSTKANSKRAYVESISVYKTGTSTTSNDISSSSDCLGLETFIDSYMHMNYSQNLGYCKDSTHHYYSSAKSAFNQLNDHQRSLFVNNSAYATEWARLSAWASANGESINSNNELAQRTVGPSILKTIEQNNATIVLAILVLAGIASIGACAYFYKKKSL